MNYSPYVLLGEFFYVPVILSDSEGSHQVDL